MTTETTAIKTKNIVDSTADMPYTLRQLEASDIFLMAKIVSAIGVKEFKNCFTGDSITKMIKTSDAEDVTAAVGFNVFMDIATIVLAGLPKCESDIYAFLARLSGKEPKYIESLPMNTFIQMIVDVIRKKEFKDFFLVVSKLFK